MEAGWHRIHYTLFSRLATAAETHFARQSRYIDPDAVPESTISKWLDDLERDRIAPSPTPEPGDVLVKQDRGEIWMHDRAGWRELAPIELQTDPLQAARDPAMVETAAREFPPPIKRALAELLELENAIDVTVAAAELPDLGIDDRLRAFRDGIDTARKMLLDIATTDLRAEA